MAELVMPRLSDSMEAATVVEWLVSVGDDVSAGDQVALVETDKATVPLEAVEGGTLREILVPAGSTAALGTPLAVVGARAVRAKASPVARRIAAQHGIDLQVVTGRGPHGRIVKADVEAALAEASAPPVANGAAQPVPALAPAPPLAPDPAFAQAAGLRGAVRELELSRLQQTVARRMTEAKATVPDFVVRTQVDMEACAELRAQLKALDEAGPVPSYTDLVVKACALTLREQPEVNASYRDGRIHLYERVNVGVAVAADHALIVPTVFDADRRALSDIARETRAAAQKVRDGTIAPGDTDGATFTVSNLGMLDVTSFTAVINPPQAAILAVGAVRPLAVVHEGEIAARLRMDIALTCDHRIIYGADGARFIARVKRLLEQPLRLWL